MQSCRKTLLALTVAWFAVLTPELSSAQAQTLAPQPLTELERLSFESTPVLPKPDYLSGQRRWQDFGVYFGIGVRRLEARPTADMCIDCKTMAEIKEKQLQG